MTAEKWKVAVGSWEDVRTGAAMNTSVGYHQSPRAPRVPLDDVTVKLYPEGFHQAFVADAVNMGRGGVSMRGSVLPQVGTSLRCSFDSLDGGEPISIVGQVVWAHESGHYVGEFGLRFTELDVADQARIEDTIATWRRNASSPRAPQVRLRLDGVQSPIVASVTAEEDRLLRVAQELPFLAIGTGVEEEGAGKRGRLSQVELDVENDVPRLILGISYEVGESIGEASDVASAVAYCDELDTLQDDDAESTTSTHASPSDAASRAVEPSAPEAMATPNSQTVATESPMTSHAGASNAPSATADASRTEDRVVPRNVAGSGSVVRARVATAMQATGRAAVRGARVGGAGVVSASRAFGAMVASSVGRFARWVRRTTSWIFGIVLPKLWQRIRFAALRIRRFGSALMNSTGRSDKRRSTKRIQRTPSDRPPANTRRNEHHIVKPFLVGAALVACAWSAYHVWSAESDEAASRERDAVQASSAVEVNDAARPTTDNAPTLTRSATQGTVDQFAAAAPPVAASAAPRQASQPAAPRPSSTTQGALAPDTSSAVRAQSAPAAHPTAPEASPSAAQRTVNGTSFGAADVPDAETFVLRMNNPVRSMEGIIDDDGFSVTVVGSLSLSRAGPIATAHPSVEHASILNRGDVSELTVRFVAGTTPTYRVQANGATIEILIAPR